MQGSSPAPLVDTLQKQHAELEGYTLRGLATIDPATISDAELDDLHSKGVRGARFHKMAWVCCCHINFRLQISDHPMQGHGAQSDGEDILADVTAVAARTARLGWVIDIFCPITAWAHMAEAVRNMDSRIKVVADHFGGAFPGDENTEAFQKFLQLVREKRVFVKLSGFERLYHGHANNMEAIEPIAKAIIEAGPDQIIYGSDWPHTQLGISRQGKTDEQRLNEVEGFRDVPDAEHIRKLREWIRDDATWHKLFVANSDKLFE